MQKRLLILSLTTTLFLGGCSTVTVTPSGKAKTSISPTYEESKSFYLFGLIGEQEVDVTKYCQGQEPQQMQTQSTFLDSFLGIITIGIYSPRTLKVWCGKKS